MYGIWNTIKKEFQFGIKEPTKQKAQKRRVIQVLILPIKKKWFDMIKSGEKKEEYREIKPYYTARFKNFKPRVNNFGMGEWIYSQIIIIFRNGYKKDSPTIKCKCRLRIGQGKEEWGAEPNKEYYILDILSVEEE